MTSTGDGGEGWWETVVFLGDELICVTRDE